MRLFQKDFDDVQIIIALVLVVIGETGGQQAFLQRRNSRNLNSL
jgi:hypothetical protein